MMIPPILNSTARFISKARTNSGYYTCSAADFTTLSQSRAGAGVSSKNYYFSWVGSQRGRRYRSYSGLVRNN